MFSGASKMHPVNVKLKTLVVWSLLVISNCANRMLPSEVSTRIFAILTDDSRGSMTSLLAKGSSSSSFKAVDCRDKQFHNKRKSGSQLTGRIDFLQTETLILEVDSTVYNCIIFSGFETEVVKFNHRPL